MNGEWSGSTLDIHLSRDIWFSFQGIIPSLDRSSLFFELFSQTFVKEQSKASQHWKKLIHF